MQHYGDITKIKGAEVPIVDVVTGGSPCQDLSSAGKRAGLAGERSGLFMEQIRIIKEMRDEDKRLRPTRGADEYIRPRYMVWENVPGAFNSNKGEDFRAVLEETARIADQAATIPRPAEKKGKLQWSTSGCVMGDGWSIAWRLHDAQFWGVPQRRKRISLVADFGGATAPEILFERESMSGGSSESGEARKGTAEDVERGVGEAIGFTNRGFKSGKVTEILRSEPHGAYPMVAYDEGGMAVVQSVGVDTYNQSIDEEVAQPLRAADGGDSTPKVCYRKTSHAKSKEDGQGWQETEVNDTLNIFDNGESRTPTVIVEGFDSYNILLSGEKAKTLQSEGGGTGVNEGCAVCQSVVRRLTPLECERLQGFPDGWTDIGEWYDSKGKKHKDADSPRYKALGNSIALPFWKWMAKRMRNYLGDNPTMASLFDGIGGFPLSYQEAGVKPVWASEIEEFPIAVTKIRFPD